MRKKRGHSSQTFIPFSPVFRLFLLLSRPQSPHATATDLARAAHRTLTSDPTSAASADWTVGTRVAHRHDAVLAGAFVAAEAGDLSTSSLTALTHAVWGWPRRAGALLDRVCGLLVDESRRRTSRGGGGPSRRPTTTTATTTTTDNVIDLVDVLSHPDLLTRSRKGGAAPRVPRCATAHGLAGSVVPIAEIPGTLEAHRRAILALTMAHRVLAPHSNHSGTSTSSPATPWRRPRAPWAMNAVDRSEHAAALRAVELAWTACRARGGREDEYVAALRWTRRLLRGGRIGGDGGGREGREGEGGDEEGRRRVRRSTRRRVQQRAVREAQRVLRVQREEGGGEDGEREERGEREREGREVTRIAYCREVVRRFGNNY